MRGGEGGNNGSRQVPPPGFLSPARSFKIVRRFREGRDVRLEFIERRHLPVADFIPMVLMNPKQFQQKPNRVVVLDFVLLLPFGDGLQKFLVKVGRRCLGRARS